MLRERGLQTPLGFDGHSQRSVDELAKKFVSLRENELYVHKNCTSECKVFQSEYFRLTKSYLHINQNFFTSTFSHLMILLVQNGFNIKPSIFHS